MPSAAVLAGAHLADEAGFQLAGLHLVAAVPVFWRDFPVNWSRPA